MLKQKHHPPYCYGRILNPMFQTLFLIILFNHYIPPYSLYSLYSLDFLIFIWGHPETDICEGPRMKMYEKTSDQPVVTVGQPVMKIGMKNA